MAKLKNPMNKEELFHKMTDLSYRMNCLVHDMYEAGFTEDDVLCAVDDGSKEYRVMKGEEE